MSNTQLKKPNQYWGMNVPKYKKPGSPLSLVTAFLTALPFTDLIQSTSFTFITYSASFLRLAESSFTYKVLCCFWGPHSDQRPHSSQRWLSAMLYCSISCCGVPQLLMLCFQRLEIFFCLSWSCISFFLNTKWCLARLVMRL